MLFGAVIGTLLLLLQVAPVAPLALAGGILATVLVVAHRAARRETPRT
jgi:hypothetical protein